MDEPCTSGWVGHVHLPDKAHDVCSLHSLLLTPHLQGSPASSSGSLRDRRFCSTITLNENHFRVPIASTTTSAKVTVETPTTSPATHCAIKMSSKTESKYRDWTREELEDGIASVEAEIFALKAKLEAEEKVEAEEKRKAQKAKLLAGIKKIKAKLRELGAGETGMRVSKRKRHTKGNRRNAVRRPQDGERKTLIVKLPVRVAADLVEEAQQDE